MPADEVEKWLIKEAKNKNSLAEAYLSLLKNATPEMKEHWYSQLGAMLKVIEDNKGTIRKELMSRQS